MTSTNELFNCWIKWPDSWPVDFGEKEFKTCKNCGREVEYEDTCRRQHSIRRTSPITWPQKYLRQSRKRAIRSSHIVRKAIMDGLITNLRTEWVKCSDCPKRATCYDHRDYTKPLEVDPVCNGCNVRRGSARFSAGGVLREGDRVSASAVLRNIENPKKRHLAGNKTNEKSCKRGRFQKDRVLSMLNSVERK